MRAGPVSAGPARTAWGGGAVSRGASPETAEPPRASDGRMSDEDLGSRFAAGDPGAVRDAYDRYAGPVFSVAMSCLGDRELAADAVQQTFVKAWRAAASYDPARPLGPWLYAIARRVAVDVWRRERQPTQSGHDRETDVAVTPLSFERTWEAWEVRSALQRLPDAEREVLRLTHYVGMSQSEIAEELGVPVGTVKSRAHRAHRRLAGHLGHLLEVTS